MKNGGWTCNHADFFVDPDGNYQLYPISYEIVAFDGGGRGSPEPLTMTNFDGLNLTAQAVRNGDELYVIIINKENGTGARNAAVTIAPSGFIAGNVAATFLVQTNGVVAATNGVTLGGTSISGASPWRGNWTTLDALSDGRCVVTVPAAPAAVVKISAR